MEEKKQTLYIILTLLHGLQSHWDRVIGNGSKYFVDEILNFKMLTEFNVFPKFSTAFLDDPESFKIKRLLSVIMEITIKKNVI